MNILIRYCVLPIPTLSRLEALPATNINGNIYTANWRKASETVDYYVVTRTVYNKDTGETRSWTYSTDNGDITSITFDDRMPGEVHTYFVQSYRLGYMSEPSNVITIDMSGITGLEADKPLQVLQMDGAILIKCSEDLGNAVIYDMAGRIVRRIDNLQNDMVIELPRGIYLLKTSTCRTAWKIAVQ